MSYYRSDYNSLAIYTDGSCLSNGLPNARAGYAIYCPQDQRLNYACRLRGRQTNQRAEIKAAMCAVERAKQFGYYNIRIMLDSQYTKKGIEEWLPRWEDEGRDASQVTNFNEFYDLQGAIDTMENVTFRKISREDNQQADSWAKMATELDYGQCFIPKASERRIRY